MSQPLTKKISLLNITQPIINTFSQAQNLLKENVLILDFDLQHQFELYNNIFFEDLLNQVSVNFSEKMTKSAGLFSFYNGKPVIRLSIIILKYRSIKEIKETLLHEMIHAYCYYKKYDMSDDLSGHGYYFKKKMFEINKLTGFKISIYHHFIKEINLYSNIWRCNGKCRNKKPNFGFIIRQNNRKPQKADGSKFKVHKKYCGGEYEKLNISVEEMEIIIKNLNKEYEYKYKSKSQKSYNENTENYDYNKYDNQMKIENFLINKTQNNRHQNITTFAPKINIKNFSINKGYLLNIKKNQTYKKKKKLNFEGVQLNLDNFIINNNINLIDNRKNDEINCIVYKSQTIKISKEKKIKKKNKLKLEKNQTLLDNYLLKLKENNK